jgi:hypothetical protein
VQSSCVLSVSCKSAPYSVVIDKNQPLYLEQKPHNTTLRFIVKTISSFLALHSPRMSSGTSMSCDICGSFKRYLPIRKFSGQFVEKVPNSTFRRSNILFHTLKHSAHSCHTCQVLQEGISGCLEKHNHLSSEIQALDFQFEYYLYDDDVGELDCRKLITLQFGNLSEFNIEFFTLPGKIICITGITTAR